MIIHSITIQDACGVPGKRSIELPDRGLVLVEGINGSGKTSLLLDGPAVACWDETTRPLRAAEGSRTVPGWNEDGSDGSVTLDATLPLGRITIVRARTSGKQSLAWTGAPLFDTASKAQPALDPLVGPFMSWRRSCCFSSADAVRLSIASMTDGQLKRVVERLLDVDFDGAAKQCSAELRTAEREASRAEQHLSGCCADARARTEHAQEAARDLESRDDVPQADTSDVPTLERRLAATRQLMTDERQALEAEERAASDVRARQDAARQQVRLLKSDRCPTCRRPFNASENRTVVQELERDLAAFSRETERRETAARAARDEIQDLDESLATLERTLRRTEANAAVLAERQAARRTAAQRLETARRAVQDAQRALEGATAVKAQTSLRVATIEACAQVLGLQGPRASIVQRALATVEGTANQWLARLSLNGMRILLQTGDALELEGAGRGRGYAAASDGQRRRVDLALWRGLAELSPRHRGATLLLDEPLDGLDQQGREAAAEALERLAHDRCVVLITHDQQLALAVEGRAIKKETITPP